MKCENTDILISALIDGELSESESNQLRNHLDNCSSCRKKLEITKAMTDRLRGLNKIEGDLSGRNTLLASLHDQIEQESPPTISRPWLTSPRLAWVGAAAVLVIIFGVLFVPESGINTIPTQTPIEPSEFSLFHDELIAGIVEYMEDERVFAQSHEVFSEHVIAIYRLDSFPQTQEINLDLPLDQINRNGDF